MRAIAGACLAVVFALAPSRGALAQDSESSRVAKQLAAALEAAKIDSIAAKDPTRPGTYIAALYFSGTQLLVISAQYPAPTLLDEKLLKKEYRDIYGQLRGRWKTNGVRRQLERAEALRRRVSADVHRRRGRV